MEELDGPGVVVGVVGAGKRGTLSYFVAPPGRPQEAAEAENWMAGMDTAPRTGDSKRKGLAQMTSLEGGPG